MAWTKFFGEGRNGLKEVVIKGEKFVVGDDCQVTYMGGFPVGTNPVSARYRRGRIESIETVANPSTHTDDIRITFEKVGFTTNDKDFPNKREILVSSIEEIKRLNNANLEGGYM